MDTKIQEAYKTLQAEWVRVNDVRVGDKVRGLVKVGPDYLGGDTSDLTSGSREQFIDNKAVGTIRSVESDYVYLDCGLNYCGLWSFPFFVLEIVDQPRDKSKMIEIKGKLWSEDTIDEALRKHAN